MQYQIIDDRITKEFMTPSSEGANSIDLRACITEAITLSPGEQLLIPCGIKADLPYQSMGMLIPRSGKGVKGLVLGNLVGNIDPDYRGEVKVCLWNRGDITHTIEPMERIAQIVVVETYAPVWIQTNELSPSTRNEGGFGSTGDK